MTAIVNLSRRQFLGATAFTAGSLVLGIKLPLVNRALAADQKTAAATLNVFLSIAPDGRITFQNPFCEMGQGTYTSIPAIIAEELDAELAMFNIVQAPHGPDYQIMFNNTTRFTGGSFSVRSSFMTLRKAGAAARAMLIQAAAQQWQVPAEECRTTPGRVIHAASGRALSYGELASAAAELEPPADPTLKNSRDFRLIGKPVKRTDTQAKCNGSAQFGIDVRLPGMVYAAVRQCPVFGGKVANFDPAAVNQRPGVVAVEQFPNGVAVLAESFWQAKTALDALPVTFAEGGNATLSSAELGKAMKARLDEPGVSAEAEGDVVQALQEAAQVLETVYEAPLLAHATMEPMNCTASVKDGACEVWAPNQGPDFVAKVAMELTGLPSEKITVHTPFLGGGFGRRFILDYVVQAVTLAKAIQRPVQVVWSREEDTQHDFYRPLAVVKLRGGLDAAGKPTALHATAVGDGPLRRHMSQSLSNPDIDESVVEGLIDQPYQIANQRIDYVYHAIPVPIGFWRSVGNSMNAFFKECFIDELAQAAGKDPVAFRQALLTNQPRFRAVLDGVAELAGWTSTVVRTHANGERRALGVALHQSFGSLVGQVAEVSVAGNTVQVHRVWCVVDCGSVVNPDIVEAQMQSGIAFGLSAALLEEITVEKGRVVQGNFSTYPILPPERMPEVTVRIIESGAELGGIGEPGTPPIAPAVANAVSALTGKRVRKLPIRLEALAET